MLKNKDEDYFVFNYHSTKPKKIIFINQKNNKDEFKNQNIGGKVISEIKLAKDINVIFSNENKSLENYYFNFFLGCFVVGNILFIFIVLLQVFAWMVQFAIHRKAVRCN